LFQAKSQHAVFRIFATVVVIALSFFGFAVPAHAVGGNVGITQSVKLSGGAPSSAITVGAGSSYIWTVNFTCSNDDCHDGMIRLNFPSSMVAGTASYSVSEVSRVIRTSTQLTFVLNSTIAVGTSSQITVNMSVAPWTTPNGTVADHTSNFSTSDGENITTATNTVTVRSANTTTVNAGFSSGGNLDDFATTAVTVCPVAPTTAGYGPVGIAAGSVIKITIPANVVFQSAPSGSYNASTREVTWTVASAITSCVSYNLITMHPSAYFAVGQNISYPFTWTGTDIGSSSPARTLGTSTALVSLVAPGPANVLVDRTSVPPTKWIGSGGSIDFKAENPNDSSQPLDSISIYETIPIGLGLTTVTIRNLSSGPASLFIKSKFGADGIQGNADDNIAYVAQSGISAGSTVVVDVSATMPSGAAAMSGGNYVTYIKANYGQIPVDSGSMDLLSYNWVILATTRTGVPVVVGDVFPETAYFVFTETVPGFAPSTRTLFDTSTTSVSAEPPPPAPSLATRVGLRNNLSANLQPGVRSAPFTAGYAAYSADLPDPVLFLIQPADTVIPNSSLVVKNGSTTLTNFTVTRTSGFGYNTSSWITNNPSLTGELIKITFPSGTKIASGTTLSVDFTLDLQETLMGSPTVVAAFSSSTNNSYGMEAQYWGAFGDTSADLDGDGRVGNTLNTGTDSILFPTFTAQVVPAASVAASLTQSVKGSWDTAFIGGPSTGYTTPGATDGFRVSLKNRGTVRLDAATVITILPRPGDTNVLSTSVRNASSSTFPVLLTSVPTLPAGLTGSTVSYSTQSNICRTELNYSPAGCVSASWSTTPPGNLQTVTALKFDFGANVLLPGRTWNVDMTVTTPTSGATEPDFAIVNPLVNSPLTNEKAKSSSAYIIREFGQSSFLNAAESPAVLLAMPGIYGPAGIPPTAPDVSTTGVGVTPQRVSVSAPANGSVTMLTPAGASSSGFSIPGQGTYTLANGRITFEPVSGFSGVADPIIYRVTDVFGQTGIATYTATVTLPGVPSAIPVGISIPQSSGGGSVSVAIPPGGTLRLIDGSGNPATSVAVPGEGTYTVNSATGRIDFVPVPAFSGTATPVPYRVTDSYGQSTSSTVAMNVVPPTTPTPQFSSGYNKILTSDPAVSQSVVISVPAGVTLQMRSPLGTSQTSYTIPGEGVYDFDSQTGEIKFTPVYGYAGTPAAITVAFVDSFGQVGLTTYTPTVLAPAFGPLSPLTGPGGVGTTPQTINVTVPPSGSVKLVDPQGNSVTTLNVPGEGTYTVVPSTGVVTFVPENGFDGATTPVTYRVSDVYQSTSTETMTTTVTVPAAPSPQAGTTTGTDSETHVYTPTIPAGSTLTLVDSGGNSVTGLSIPGQGTYSISGGRILFIPETGYNGVAVVTYGVIDGYGQRGTATLSSAVTPVPRLGLAQTGVVVMPALALALFMLGGGILAVLRRRREIRNN
jgi:CshA-type fibril repeat protein